MAEAKARYTRRELWHWVAWEHEHGPITIHERIDSGFARSNWLFAEANRNRKKRKRPFQVSDFMPAYGGKSRRRRKSPEELWKHMETVAMMMQAQPGANTRQ